ncbi:MAG: hypothetical protein JXA33_16170 [Anaerolineae bacterium]|nr:hypothetical protein [Anaerolineae bacterium]
MHRTYIGVVEREERNITLERKSPILGTRVRYVLGTTCC